MKNVSITAVGKIKEKYFIEAAEEYVKRLGKSCKLTVNEIADIAADNGVKRESDGILASFGGGEYRILTDINGELVTSEELSDIMENAYLSGKSTVRFIIGGSDGVDGRVKAACDKRISFGRVTYPHRLMRVILLEQIYRAFTIKAGLPYHK